MKTLNVMSFDFTYKAALRGFESLIIENVWNGIGTLKMTINNQITNADLIEIDDILFLETDKAFIVEKIEEKLSGSTIDYEITAVSLNALLRDYITIPPIGKAYDNLTAKRESIVRTWVTNNIITPTDNTRKLNSFVLGENRALGNSISEQTRYKNLADEVSRVLLPEDLGYKVVIDIPNKQFVFNVYQGVNRTSLQSVNSRILFGLKYGNISDYKKVKDTTATKNIVYVAGQGEGADRTIVEVAGTGTRRKETFVDARDIDLLPALMERGNQKLNELSEINNYEFETIERQFRYGIDYDLGDYVTVVLDKDNIQHLQLQRVKEVYEAGKISIIPEFGKPEKTITSVVQSTSKRIASLETETSDTSALAEQISTHVTDLITDSDGAHGLRIETGLWTPVLYGSTTAGAHTYAAQTEGQYYKVGKMVFIQGRISLSAKDAAMAGDARISGFPFANGSGYSNGVLSLGSFQGVDIAAGYTFAVVKLLSATATAALLRMGDNVATVAIASSEISASLNIDFSGVYKTA